MIIHGRQLINELVQEVKKYLIGIDVSVYVAADSEGVYDVRLTLEKYPENTLRSIAFSYDSDTGYYIDIGGLSQEFNDNERLFRSTALRQVVALKNRTIQVVEKRMLGLVVSRELLIEDRENEDAKHTRHDR